MREVWDHRAFPSDEHHVRLDRVRTVLEKEDLSCCVCTSPELIYYFTGYEAHTHHAIGSQAMILGAGEPILILRDGDVPQADETLVVGQLRPFRLGAVSLADLIKDAIEEVGGKASPVGLDISGPTMNGALMSAIQQGLEGCELRDCWRLLGRLRTVLSEREVSYVMEAAGYANSGIDAFYKSAKPGMSEIELAAEIEYAMRAAGSDYPAVPTWMGSGERAHCMHGMATKRRFQVGDLVHTEFAGVARRYQCVTMGSLVFGEPSARMQELENGAKEAFQEGLAAARVGGRIGDMETAYRAVLKDRNLAETCPMRFGVGISAAYPPIWENQVTIQYECDDLFETGMAFYIHSTMQSMEDRTGMLLGGSFLMTADGPKRLDKAPIALIVIHDAFN